MNNGYGAYSSKPGVVPHERRRRGCDCAPPEAPDTIPLDPVAEDGRPPGPLGLKRRLERVDRCENHAKSGSASNDIVNVIGT